MNDVGPAEGQPNGEAMDEEQRQLQHQEHHQREQGDGHRREVTNEDRRQMRYKGSKRSLEADGDDSDMADDSDLSAVRPR